MHTGSAHALHKIKLLSLCHRLALINAHSTVRRQGASALNAHHGPRPTGNPLFRLADTHSMERVELQAKHVERRPSATTFGMLAKSLSTSTSYATLRAAPEPAAMATLQSAALSASVSLTPSPVIATVWARPPRTPRSCA